MVLKTKAENLTVLLLPFSRLKTEGEVFTTTRVDQVGKGPEEECRQTKDAGFSHNTLMTILKDRSVAFKTTTVKMNLKIKPKRKENERTHGHG